MTITVQASEVAECFRCGERKPTSSFYADGSKASGRKSICKACDRAKAAAYYAENSERVISRTIARYREVHDSPDVRLCARCGEPATSQRHKYCDGCREEAGEERFSRGRS